MACTTYSKLVNSLQAQVRSVNYTIFFNLIFGVFFMFELSVGRTVGRGRSFGRIKAERLGKGCEGHGDCAMKKQRSLTTSPAGNADGSSNQGRWSILFHRRV